MNAFEVAEQIARDATCDQGEFNARVLSIIPYLTEHADEMDRLHTALRRIRNFKSASVEEFWQFVIGQFFAVGGFWLGIERLVTVGYWDALFLMCVVSVIAGCVIGYFGYCQLQRCQTRIDHIIASANARAQQDQATRAGR